MARSRRELFGGGLAIVTASAYPALAQEAVEQAATPGQRTGPFYPEVRAGETAVDLTRVAGRSERAIGSVVHVDGRLLDRRGQPIGSALILIWQADAKGRYGHSGDGGPAAADPGFGGHAMLRTAADGSFGLTTVRPGAYADNRSTSGLRTPHVHFEIIGETGRLITEMYFPDEQLNDTDANIAELVAKGGDPRLLMARLGDAPSGSAELALRWDVVLSER